MARKETSASTPTPPAASKAPTLPTLSSGTQADNTKDIVSGLKSEISTLQEQLVKETGLRKGLQNILSSMKKSNSNLQKRNDLVKKQAYKNSIKDRQMQPTFKETLDRSSSPEQSASDLGSGKMLAVIAGMLFLGGKFIMSNIMGPKTEQTIKKKIVESKTFSSTSKVVSGKYNMEELVISMMGGAADDMPTSIASQKITKRRQQIKDAANRAKEMRENAAIEAAVLGSDMMVGTAQDMPSKRRLAFWRQQDIKRDAKRRIEQRKMQPVPGAPPVNLNLGAARGAEGMVFAPDDFDRDRPWLNEEPYIRGLPWVQQDRWRKNASKIKFLKRGDKSTDSNIRRKIITRAETKRLYQKFGAIVPPGSIELTSSSGHRPTNDFDFNDNRYELVSSSRTKKWYLVSNDFDFRGLNMRIGSYDYPNNPREMYLSGDPDLYKLIYGRPVDRKKYPLPKEIITNPTSKPDKPAWKKFMKKMSSNSSIGGGIKLAAYNSPMTSKPDFNRIKEILGEKESSGDYEAINSLSYIGKYQFGYKALIDVGEVKSSATSNNDIINDPSVWNTPGGFIAFLKDPQRQERAMDKFLEINYTRLSASIPGFKNLTIEQKAGLLGAAHLAGAGGAAKWYKTGKEPSDKFGTKPSDYYKSIIKEYNSILAQNGITSKTFALANAVASSTSDGYGKVTAAFRQGDRVLNDVGAGVVYNYNPVVVNEHKKDWSKDSVFTV